MLNREIQTEISGGYIEPKGDWIFESGFGLDITVEQAWMHRYHEFPSPYTYVGSMIFMPRGTITENILAGIRGLQSFFEEIDIGKTEPEYLIGVTTKHTAYAAAKIGFDIVDVSPDIPAVEDKKFKVVGKTEDIRQGLRSILDKTDKRGRNIVDILSKRLESRKIQI